MKKQIWAILLICLWPVTVAAGDSTCFGTTGNGRLENGVRLPASGKNFSSYSLLGITLGRTYVHSKVAATVADAFEALEQTRPDTVFVYGETGFRSGGSFRPHKTHQNGLSVDFMIPVRNKKDKSIPLPTHAFNKWGYDLEFDATGRLDNMTIDFEAMADHLAALHKAAKGNGIGIWRVIFDPQLQPFLWNTKNGAYLKANLQFSTKRSWVRHDDHYHVDFELPCRPL